MFIYILDARLCETGIEDIHAKGDGDKIIKKAVEKSKFLPIVLVGDDTDLFVFYCFMPITISKRYISL